MRSIAMSTFVAVLMLGVQHLVLGMKIVGDQPKTAALEIKEDELDIHLRTHEITAVLFYELPCPMTEEKILPEWDAAAQMFHLHDPPVEFLKINMKEVQDTVMFAKQLHIVELPTMALWINGTKLPYKTDTEIRLSVVGWVHVYTSPDLS
eukprot:gnl/TRDRNA2_/TRDRNA2_210492_c0_seq1.p1 gnl/TRDRNA2_/TRDRNA2_210492_c0~~gnl/TRDRNA2_/TRDRNA2_210492_c0_seq1.p1  ORF type:complete len:150 (+),score=26.62 gnl/TRDRNA2_/TRDRNA2_210492_c0_seq1:46-495(+)